MISVGSLSRNATPKSSVPGLGATPPATPSTPSDVQTVYHQARQLFSKSNSGNKSGSVVGRDEERALLRSFLYDNCDSKTDAANKTTCGCLYVSGPPGTGKSATVHEMTEEVCAELSGTVRKAYINCQSIRSSRDLYDKLLKLLVFSSTSGEDLTEAAWLAHGMGQTEMDAAKALEALLMPKSSGRKQAAGSKHRGGVAAAPLGPSTFLVVLDEIDHILTLDLESLYRVIEWSLLKTSRLVLVGIANALDMTDRFLPRLKARKLHPELLPFLPYTAPQIKNIITARLRGALALDSGSTDLPFIHPAAIDLCSRKVASQTGDLRKAFEIVRGALHLVEDETREKFFNSTRDTDSDALSTAATTPTAKRPLAENMNLASSSPRQSRTPAKRPSWSAWSSQNLTIESAPRVTIGHINKVTSAAFGSGVQQRLKGLNLQQKAVLCALMAFEKWNRETHAAADAAQRSSMASLTALASSNGVRRLVKPCPPSVAQRAAGGASVAPKVRKLYDTYSQMCKRDAVLHPMSSTEFREVVHSLETLSLITAVDGRTGSFSLQPVAGSGGRGTGRRGRPPKGSAGLSSPASGSGPGSKAIVTADDEKRVASCVGEKEFVQALEGIGSDILRSILDGEIFD